MTERVNEWPRVHTCLHNWCPHKHSECSRCDAVVAVLRGDCRQEQHVIDYYRRLMSSPISSTEGK